MSMPTDCDEIALCHRMALLLLERHRASSVMVTYFDDDALAGTPVRCCHGWSEAYQHLFQVALDRRYTSRLEKLGLPAGHTYPRPDLPLCAACQEIQEQRASGEDCKAMGGRGSMMVGLPVVTVAPEACCMEHGWPN